MLKNNLLKFSLLFLLLPAFIFAGVEDELKKINDKLDKIDKRLIVIEKKGAAPPKQNNNKNQTDPNKVYNVPVANSVVLGNPDAKITVIKWTDFQ